MPLCIALAFYRKSSIYYLALAEVEVCVSKYVYEVLEDISLFHQEYMVCDIYTHVNRQK